MDSEMISFWGRRLAPETLNSVMRNRVCFKGDDNAIKGMFGDSEKEYTVKVQFKHCWEYGTPEECATDEEAVAFWSTSGIYIYVNDFHQYTDLKNQTEPLQWTTNLKAVSISWTAPTVLKYRLE